MCVLIVASPTNSSRAISAFERPRATKVKTSSVLAWLFKLAQAEYAFAGTLSPGSAQEQPVATPTGIYVLASFMASQDGSEHTKLGMIKTITVVK
jgi:hypothetical protein